MSTCGDCGVYVRFLVLEEFEGRKVWSPPLTPDTSEVKVLTKGRPGFAPTFRLTETFVVHECEQRKAKEAQKQQNYAIARDRQRHTQEAWREALKRSCPKCGVARRERCVNLSDVRRGKEPRETSYPHADRLPPGWSEAQVALAQPDSDC